MLHLTTLELLVQRRWVADVEVQLEFETPDELLAVYVRSVGWAPFVADKQGLLTEDKWLEISPSGTGIEPLLYSLAEKAFKAEAKAIRDYFPAVDHNAEHRMTQRGFI